MTTGSTPKRKRFAQEIIRGKSQSDAYLIAFKADRMKPDTIHKRASELMADGWVTGRVAELASGVERELTIQVADLLREAGRIVFFDIRKITTKDNGTLLLPHELDADTSAAIKSFEIDKDGPSSTSSGTRTAR